jgi:hypothetical protein
VFVTVTATGTLEVEPMVVDVDVGRPVSVTGASDQCPGDRDPLLLTAGEL